MHLARNSLIAVAESRASVALKVELINTWRRPELPDAERGSGLATVAKIIDEFPNRDAKAFLLLLAETIEVSIEAIRAEVSGQEPPLVPRKILETRQNSRKRRHDQW